MKSATVARFLAWPLKTAPVLLLVVFSALLALATKAVLLGIEAAGREKMSRRVRIVAWVVYLVTYAGGTLILANAAHEGGRLVHELGVKAGWTAAPGGDGPAGGGAGGDHDHDD